MGVDLYLLLLINESCDEAVNRKDQGLPLLKIHLLFCRPSNGVKEHATGFYNTAFEFVPSRHLNKPHDHISRGDCRGAVGPFVCGSLTSLEGIKQCHVVMEPRERSATSWR